ncbi:MAG: hypothetical protein AAFU33_05015 [Bacteroidota bacterium]
MKYLGPIIFFLIFLSFGCQIPDPNTGSGATSQLNDGFVEELVELGTEVQEMAKPNKVRAWVSKLIVKAQPGKEMPQVGLMEEGEVAEYLYQRTVRKSEFSLRGQRFYQPWILIKTQSGVMGWVHEGGVSYLTPDYEQILNDLLNTKTNARQAAPKDPAVDRLIVPGKQFGAIKLNTSESELISIYGPTRVARGEVSVPNNKRESCTVVFPRTKDEIRITWKDDTRSKVKAIYLGESGSSWYTSQGLGVGISLLDLIKANKAPIEFYGFGWEYGGTIETWKNGTLQSRSKYFYVRLAPGRSVPDSKVTPFKSKQLFTSNDPGVEDLDIRVTRLVVYLD